MENNVFRVDLREQKFLLWEQFRIQEKLLKMNCYSGVSQELVNDLLDNAKEFSYKKLGTCYKASDREGCRIDSNGNVFTPDSFKELWTEFKSAGWGKIVLPEDKGGIGCPYMLYQVINELFLGANPSFITYTGFGLAIARLIELYGSDEQKEYYCNKLLDNIWSGAFVVTESDAGSDLGNVSTKAIKLENGSYRIIGEKMFISAGMHDLTDNIIYIVLARVQGAPNGTRGLSAFIVPKLIESEMNNEIVDNNILCTGIENKMGLHGCSTTQLSFGAKGITIGYLLGEKENIGLLQVFEIMNQARITTGIYSLGMSSSAYLNTTDYAKKRIQGVDLKQSFNTNAERIPINHHDDVKRNLLEMKSKVEGCRALIYKLCYHFSIYMGLEKSNDDTEKIECKKNKGIAELLIPLVKAYTSDQAWRVCELGIQVFGGYGYTKDYPIEQYARDVKIMSIWEGTNYMQSVDLVRFKLKLGNDKQYFDQIKKEIDDFVDDNNSNDKFIIEMKLLSNSMKKLDDTVNEIKNLYKQNQIPYIFSISTTFLSMFSKVVISWLLMDSAVIANKKLIENSISSYEEELFYQGKISSALFFLHNVLPEIDYQASIIFERNMTVVNSSYDIFM